ncbi:MAG: Jag family protein [Promethearchaeota archaeon]
MTSDTELQAQTIKTLIETILDKMGILASVRFLENSNGLQFHIKTEDGGILIGENGQNLIALNHIVKRLIEKNYKEDKPLQFSLDINNYQAKKAEELRSLARMSAQRARFFKKEIAMQPMTSYERRIIHTALAEYPDITTESTGEVPYRRVVIKPL